MMPILKSYVAFIEVADGIYFEAGPRRFLLKGRNLFQTTSRICQSLDGVRTVDEIKETLPEKAHALFDRLLEELLRSNMVRISSKNLSVSEGDQVLYEGVLRLMKDETDDWSGAFSRWRDQSILLAGRGVSFRTLAQGLSSSGIRRLFLVNEGDVDREMLDGVFRQHRQKDPSFAPNWVSSEDRNAVLTTGEFRLAYVSDQIKQGYSALLDKILAARRRGTIIGGCYCGVGFVGPAIDTPDDNPLQWWERASVVRGRAYSHAAFAVLGASMAFEILRIHMAIEGDTMHLSDRFLVVDADGVVGNHPVFGKSSMLAHAHEASNVSDQNNEANIHEFVELVFDSVSGLMERTAVNGPEFPLAHRAAVSTRAGCSLGIPERVEMWAIDPSELDRRLMIAAVEFALDDYASDSIVAVAATKSECAALASAVSISLHPDFEEKASVLHIDCESISDPCARMLLRLIRLYSGALPDIWLVFDGCRPAYVARIVVRCVQATCITASPEQAIIEALGDALSTLQLGRPCLRQRRQRVGPWLDWKPIASVAGQFDSVPRPDAGFAFSSSHVDIDTLLPWHLGLFAARTTHS